MRDTSIYTRAFSREGRVVSSYSQNDNPKRHSHVVATRKCRINCNETMSPLPWLGNCG